MPGVAGLISCRIRCLISPQSGLVQSAIVVQTRPYKTFYMISPSAIMMVRFARLANSPS
jgi:hypothetical protein